MNPQPKAAKFADRSTADVLTKARRVLASIIHAPRTGSPLFFEDGHPRMALTSECAAVLAVLEELVIGEQTWPESVLRDPATAPKDGSEVILKVASRAGIRTCYLVGHWMGGGHCIEDHPPIAAGWYFWNGVMFDTPSSKILGWLPLPR